MLLLITVAINVSILKKLSSPLAFFDKFFCPIIRPFVGTHSAKWCFGRMSVDKRPSEFLQKAERVPAASYHFLATRYFFKAFT